MMILDWPAGGLEGRCHRIVLLFGLGLIGSATLAAIGSRVPARRRELPFDWHPVEEQASQSDAILSCARELVGGRRREGSRTDIVWSAGKTGFASSEDEIAAEQRTFDEVLDLSRRLHDIAESSCFHFLSSAGGLFEGQRHIDTTRKPAPLRPYGFSKLEQEEHLRALPGGMAIQIYRPSSVYGYAGAHGRKSLVTALVQNAIRYQTTRISGGPDTIRDYVFADDVGRFIADQLISPRPDAKTFLLASGKPTSMMELTTIVQGTLQRQLYFQFESRPSNALNISMRPSSLPNGWQATPLAIGIYRTAARIISAHRFPAH
jgi:nucleoside-diphosphate-sugar epimerase